MVKEVSPKQAWRILQEEPGAVLLDVRSRMEFDYVGHPVGAVNIPLQDPPGAENDPAFTDKAAARLGAAGKTAPVLALCRSGQRSMAAAQLLEQAGFQRVANIAQGFEGERDERGRRGCLGGWRFHGLPWEQT